MRQNWPSWKEEEIKEAIAGKLNTETMKMYLGLVGTVTNDTPVT